MTPTTQTEDLAIFSRLFVYLMLGCAAFVGGVVLLMNFMPAS